MYLEAALESLPRWSGSLELFAHHLPELSIVPVAVGGVISRRALLNPIVRRYRDSDKRHFLAATFQMLFPCYRDPVISLYFGQALRGESVTREEIIQQMAGLLRRVGAEQRGLMKEAARGV